MDIFAESCKRQYRQTFKMFRQALELCPDELWSQAGDDTPFWQQVYHALMVTEGYATGDFEGSGGPALQRIFGGLRKPEPGEPPFMPLIEVIRKLMEADCRDDGVLTRDEALDYLEAVAAHCEASLDLDAGREECDPASNPFPWTGKTAYDKHMYTLRHLHHHLGQMNGFLRRRGGIGNPWVVEEVSPPG